LPLKTFPLFEKIFLNFIKQLKTARFRDLFFMNCFVPVLRLTVLSKNLTVLSMNSSVLPQNASVLRKSLTGMGRNLTVL